MVVRPAFILSNFVVNQFIPDSANRVADLNPTYFHESYTYAGRRYE